jgi:hypothetical protein
MVQAVTPAHKGLAPSRLIPIFIRKDAHAGHTQEIKLMPLASSRALSLFQTLCVIPLYMGKEIDFNE